MLAIVNPTAGNGKAGHLGHDLPARFAAAGIDLHVAITQWAGHGTQLAEEAVAQDWDGVVAVGGDGTVHEVVNGLGDAPIPLGILPVGTGNDFARALGIPKNLNQCIEVIAAGHRRRVDLGEINGRRYVQVAGIGFDAQVAAAVTAHRQRLPGGGVLPYLWGILQQMVSYRNSLLTITIDGKTHQQPTLLIAAGNARFYAGGLKICPHAEIDDAMLDVCIVGDLTHLQRLNVLARVFSGSHIQHPSVSYHKATDIRVEGPSHLLIQADGQIIGHLPAHIRVIPRAIDVFAPR